MTSQQPLADMGLIGLAVMGQNLVLNFSDHGVSVSVFNRTPARTETFVAENPGHDVQGFFDLESFVASLEPPRRVMLMIKAGQPIDDQIDALVPLLSEGDVIIDGGNSLFTDSERRCSELAAHGIHFIGVGISGGEEGARHGPSIMPGGDKSAWPLVEDAFTSIAAVADGEPCAAWIGPGGAGHFVKMVHNGIEYADMQVIAEAYDIMGRGLGMDAGAIQPYFEDWNTGRLDSYLIEITAEILGHRQDDGTPTLDLIVDAAGQKGTGSWTVMASMDHATPTSLVAESVYARIVSSMLEERQEASMALGGETRPLEGTRDQVISDLHDALYAAKIISYAQGFMLLKQASNTYAWDLDFGTIAGLWRAGCIIRSRFLNDITTAFRLDTALRNLLLAPFFSDEIVSSIEGLARTVARASLAGIPVPTYSSALSFFDAYRSKRLPANLIQAQRDYFGAHTYERIDRPRGEWFHTQWSAADQSGSSS